METQPDDLWEFELASSENRDPRHGTGERNTDLVREGEEFLKLSSRLPFLQTSVLIKVTDLHSNLFTFLSLFYIQPS